MDMKTCTTNGKSGNEPSWVLEYERQERRKATEVRKREMEERIARLREKERREKLAAKKMNGRVVKKRVSLRLVVPINDEKEESTVDDENEFLLDEYRSDDEGDKDGPSKPPAESSNISPDVLQMLREMAPQPSLQKEEEEPDEIKVPSMKSDF